MNDTETRIDAKILQLKKKKEKIQLTKAQTFFKEVEKVFEDDFTPGTALLVLSDTWKTAAETQKEQWKKRGSTFCIKAFQKNRKTTQTIESTHHQS